MISLHNHLITLAIGLIFSVSVMAESTTKQQPNSITNRINAEYRVAKNKCSLLSGIAEDSCMVQAKAVKTKAITNAKPEAKTSESCAPINNKTSNNKARDTSVKVIDEDYDEDEMDSAVTEVKPTESDISPFGKDIFRDRIKVVAMR
jgi:hypothetical protein